jgi:hypothetical protein
MPKLKTTDNPERAPRLPGPDLAVVTATLDPADKRCLMKAAEQRGLSVSAFASDLLCILIQDDRIDEIDPPPGKPVIAAG